MTQWKSILTLTVAAAMVTTTAFAQSAGTTAPQRPGVKPPDSGTPGTSAGDAAKPDTSAPSAGPSTTGKDTSSGSMPSAAPATGTTDSTKSDTMKSDTMKSDTMKSDKTSKHRGMRSANGGNRGQVKAVQQALKDKGHDPGAVDGVMGPKTRTALKDFQKKEGMKDTGRLDQETRSKLGVDTKTSEMGGTGDAAVSASPSTSAPSPRGSAPSPTGSAPSTSPSDSTSTGGTSGSSGTNESPEKK